MVKPLPSAVGRLSANLTAFEDRGVALLAASVMAKRISADSIDMLGLTFPVGYGLDYLGFAFKTGTFYEVRREIIGHGLHYRQDGAFAPCRILQPVRLGGFGLRIVSG